MKVPTYNALPERNPDEPVPPGGVAEMILSLVGDHLRKTRPGFKLRSNLSANQSMEGE